MLIPQNAWMYFRIKEFEVGVNGSIFPGNVKQKVYWMYCILLRLGYDLSSLQFVQ